MNDTQPKYLKNPQGTSIACHPLAGHTPGIMFCGGFLSDMTGTKALALEQFCRDSGHSYVRFDYSGHGQSGGEFESGTIGGWLQDALTILDQATTGPQYLVGSSMGGWISLLLSQARSERVAGLILIAPAADFTEAIYWQEFDDRCREQLHTEGMVERPSDYDEPYRITETLIVEGRNHLLLNRPSIEVHCPVRILHGMRDTAVPWQNSLVLSHKLSGHDVHLGLRKDGDHRLSEADDIRRLHRTLQELMGI